MQDVETLSVPSSVGVLNEGHLHASLKARYIEPGDQSEAAVDGYIVDILRPGLIIEVQTANFSAIARKMRDLITRHRVRLVHPLPRTRWIVKLARGGGEASTRRRSPRHLAAVDVFDELVSFPELIAHPNFELDLVITEEECIWKFDGRRRRRRGGWVTVERRLLSVYDTLSLRAAADYASMLPAELPDEFLTSDLGIALGRPRYVAQKVAYCLRNGGLIERVGSRGNAIVYRRVAPTVRRSVNRRRPTKAGSSAPLRSR